jgi:hypothetical protein
MSGLIPQLSLLTTAVGALNIERLLVGVAARVAAWR